MKMLYLLILSVFICRQITLAQNEQQSINTKSNSNSENLLNPLRLSPAPSGSEPFYIDWDNDGDPDVLRTKTLNDIQIQWIDDDDDMQYGDLEGDTDSDCLMVDMNGDGNYGHYSDVVIDWVDNDSNGQADMQIYAEYAGEDQKDEPWGPGHLMINLDLDNDNIMNYIDWNTFKIRCWLHNGQSDFYEDYHGKNLFLKIHTSPEKINDPRLNWENPFLFYDPDNDGLTEYAIRTLDIPVQGNPGDKYLTRLTGNISWISMSYDLDNDNCPGNELDFDMTISFRGEGFDYTDQVHVYPAMRGLPESDQYFMDPRVRQLNQLIYPDHESIKKLIFEKGEWSEVYFTFDEDDDCSRWERVELYEPKDPYITGAWKGGLDNNAQSDPVGDRGEWDLDNSGNGSLYIGKFDGKLHLYGAETGYWRIDQNAFYYQGMGGLYDGYGPERFAPGVEVPFPLIKYTDTNQNGFFDLIEYDLDGDKIYEQTISLFNLGINDQCEIIDMNTMAYKNLEKLEEQIAKATWEQAMEAVRVAHKYRINTSWYALLMKAGTTRQKYHNGYWLQYYIYCALIDKTTRENKSVKINEITKAYYSGSWENLLKPD